MLTTAVLRELMRAGLEGEALLAACDRIEASAPAAAPALTARQARNARYYDKQKAEKEASKSDASKTIKTLSDAIKTPHPSPLKDVEPNLVTVEVTQNPTPSPPIVPPSPAKPATAATIAEQFERFWAVMLPARGKAPNPRKPAFEKFARLIRDGIKAETIISGVEQFERVERAAGRWGTDKVAQAITWLNQHRWEGYQPEEAKAPTASLNGKVWVAKDSPQWWAWRDHRISTGQRPPASTWSAEHQADGWWFEREWPPGALDGKKAEPARAPPSINLF